MSNIINRRLEIKRLDIIIIRNNSMFKTYITCGFFLFKLNLGEYNIGFFIMLSIYAFIKNTFFFFLIKYIEFLFKN